MDERQNLPAARPVRGGMLSLLLKAAGGPDGKLFPRKGTTAPQPFQNSTGLTRDRAKSRSWLIPVPALRELAERDEIIAAIRRTLRFALGEMKWRIVPDLDAVKADLKRWQTTVEVNLALPGLDLQFEPQAMSLRVYNSAHDTLRQLLGDILKPDDVGDIRQQAQAQMAGQPPPKPKAPANPKEDPRLRQFFENIVAAHDAIAQSHIGVVEELFKKPNPSAESSFRALLNLLIDDLTLFDGGVLVKNVTSEGKLGELYTFPADQLRIYRQKDGSTPQPPSAAYDRSDDARILAYYNNAELVYMMMNPQQDGYGKSPLHSIIDKMVGSIYSNYFLVDKYANNNRPYFIFDLGPNVNQYEKDAVEQQWNDKVKRGQHRGIFLGNKDGVKGFLPMPEANDNEDSVLDTMKYWAGVKVAQYGLSLNDIGFTEDLHRTTAETQHDMTQSRGFDSFATNIASYFNGEIVQGEMWMRNDPENENDLSGKLIPCFPFRDVKFEFVNEDDEQKLEKAEKMTAFVSAGVLSRNEVRREMNYPPIRGGDVYAITDGGNPMKVEDLENLPGPPDPNEQPQPMPGQPGQEQPQQISGQPKPPGLQASQGGPQLALPKPKDQQVSKSLESIERLGDTLRKLADKNRGVDNG